MTKKLNNLWKIFFSTNTQKVLSFLARRPNQSLMASEIMKATEISKAGVNIALRELLKVGFVGRNIKGRTHLYQINYHNPLVKQFKVVENIIELYPLIKKLNRVAWQIKQVILFGSTARGEDYQDSDIDLFILTHNKEEVRKIMLSTNLKSVKPIIKTPAEFAALEKKDPTFYHEVTRGITLWEKHE